jgi:acyl phosphate:glycerol-3-phosphate acyltransferase
MEYVAAALIGYLLGSVPFAWLVAARYGVDLRRAGDGNPGAWNALEQLGPERAWRAFVGDGLKGLVAGAIGVAAGGLWGGYAGVAGAMVGHAFPAFARGRGGKSVMTFAGGMFAVAPVAAVIALALCLAVTAGARSFAWGARVGVLAVAPLQLLVAGPGPTAATGMLMSFIGLLFLARRSGARATSGPVAAPRR